MSNIVNKFIGNSEEFSISHRILNATTIIGIAFTIVSGISNYIIGLPPIVNYFAAFCIIVLSLLLLFSLRTKKFKPFYYLIIPYNLFVFFPGIWFLNGGSHGSIQFFLFLLLVIILTTSEIKAGTYFVISLIVVITTLIIIEHFYPELIINYSSKEERMYDIIVSMIVVIVIIYFILRIFRQIYDKTLAKIELQNMKLKEKNILIDKQKEELLNLNADKDKFMRILAHDLRSPFNSMLGYSDLLINEIDTLSKEEIKEFAISINTVQTQTYNLLDDLLLWSQSQSGNLYFNPEKTAFNEVCNQLIEKLNNGSKKITINCNSPEDIVILADKNMLQIILRNLLSNAIKFTYPGGNIDILTETVDNEVIITISDNGVGISKEDQEKLWDFANPYSTYGTEDEKGSGLGLILCKELVEKHKGKIWVESEKDKGSKFIFTMPISK